MHSKSKDMASYKKLNEIVIKIFKEAKLLHLYDTKEYNYLEDKERFNNDFIKKIISCLNVIDEDYATIIINDYIGLIDVWWIYYFSKSTYYRKKKKAIKLFIKFFETFKHE